jgi:hypothetical protein
MADDASDVMDAALAEHVQPKDTNATALAAAKAQIPVVAEKPRTPAGPESIKARDVLKSEEKNNATPAVFAPSEDESKTEKLDAEGNPLPSKSAILKSASEKGELMIADFDIGDKPNNLGGDFGGFAKDPNDDTQDCRATFASDDALGNMDGFALRLDYDVDSPSPAYNGFWMKLENLNATPYDTLSFYARGASKRFTKRLKVELKTPDHRSASFFISGITDQWQKIQIPLKRFKGIKNWSVLSELVLVFDDVNTAPKKGTLLIDQMMLERHNQGMPSLQSVVNLQPAAESANTPPTAPPTQAAP